MDNEQQNIEEVVRNLLTTFYHSEYLHQLEQDALVNSISREHYIATLIANELEQLYDPALTGCEINITEIIRRFVKMAYVDLIHEYEQKAGRDPVEDVVAAEIAETLVANFWWRKF